MTWSLYGHFGEGGLPQRIPVQDVPFTIGRRSGNSLTVSNSTVSGEHAEILMACHDILIRDRNSTNGTLLNGRRIHNVEVLHDGDILHIGNVMFTVQKDTHTGSQATVTVDLAGEAIGHVQFETLLSRPGIEPCFQPIVELATENCIGYEVLSRSELVGLETPAKMFRIAAQRTSEAALSRVCRLEGMRASCDLDPQMQFYLNTHPAELNNADLIASLEDLRERHPTALITLEVHESAVTSINYLKTLRSALDKLDMGLAYDDFGSGQARMAELIQVPPDVLKFDIGLIRGLPTAGAAARSTISGLVRIVKDLNVSALAEGIETEVEAEICRELGFDLAQGYLFGKARQAAHWIS